MKRAVILGCLHFKENYTYGFLDKKSLMNSRLQDLLGYLDKSIEYAVENKVDSVIFLGDVFDSSNPGEFIKKLFFSKLEKLSREGIKIYIVIGNHDCDGHNSAFDSSQVLADDVLASKNFKIILKTLTVKEDGKTFVFIPWSKNISEDVDAAEGDYLFSHFCVSGDKISPQYTKFSRDKSDQVNIEKLKKFKHCFLGHIHSNYSNANFTGLGSLMRNKFDGTTDERGFLFIDFENKKKKFIKSRDRKFVKLIVQEDEKAKIVPGDIGGSIIKVVFRGSKDFVKSIEKFKILERISSLGPFKVITTTEIIKEEIIKGERGLFNIEDGVDPCIHDWLKKKCEEPPGRYYGYAMDIIKRVR